MIVELCLVIYYSVVAGMVNFRKCMSSMYSDDDSDSGSGSDEDETNFQDLSRIALNDSRYKHDFSSIYEENIF